MKKVFPPAVAGSVVKGPDAVSKEIVLYIYFPDILFGVKPINGRAKKGTLLVRSGRGQQRRKPTPPYREREKDRASPCKL